jgi:peptidoglycan/LPS O-acetylase OafA/YrhL
MGGARSRSRLPDDPSYSLSLVHEPLVQGFAHVIKTAAPELGGPAVFVVLLLALLLLSWVLFVAVERRTIGAPAKPVVPAVRFVLRVTAAPAS